MSGAPATPGTKIALVATVLGICAAGIAWGQILTTPRSLPGSTDGSSLLVLHLGGTLPRRGGPAPEFAPVRPLAPDARQTSPPDVGPAPVPPLNDRLDRSPPRDPDRVYLVREGDSLYRIAQSLWGEPERWPEIAAANDIMDPYLIREGETLRIP